jgi:hypothetical protein
VQWFEFGAVQDADQELVGIVLGVEPLLACKLDFETPLELVGEFVLAPWY